MAKQRFNFAFDLSNERHARAYGILLEYPNRRRSEFLIQAILAQSDGDALKTMIAETMREVLADNLSDAQMPAKEMPQTGSSAVLPPPESDDIPENALSFLSAL